MVCTDIYGLGVNLCTKVQERMTLCTVSLVTIHYVHSGILRTPCVASLWCGLGTSLPSQPFPTDILSLRTILKTFSSPSNTYPQYSLFLIFSSLLPGLRKCLVVYPVITNSQFTPVFTPYKNLILRCPHLFFVYYIRKHMKLK